MPKAIFTPYEMAEQTIRDDYGDRVYIKPKALLKYGRNVNVGTSSDKTTIQEFLQTNTPVITETYATTNAITHAVSSSGSDTGNIIVEGHTIDSDGNLTFFAQTVTLTGQTPKALTTPLARATRVEVADGTFASPSSAMVGTIAVMEGTTVTSGVPDDNADVHVIMSPGEQKSLKASTSYSQNDYGIITQLYGSIGKKKTANITIRFEIRRIGGVFKTAFTWELDNVSSGDFVFNPEPYLIIPKNSDVRFTAVASTTDVIVSAGFNSYLALVTE